MKAWRIALVLVATPLVWGNGAIAQTPEAEVSNDKPDSLDGATVEAALQRMSLRNHDLLPMSDEPAQTVWFTGLEVGIMQPTLVGRHFATAERPADRLDWTLSPRVSVGAELFVEDRWQLAYQFFAAHGPERFVLPATSTSATANSFLFGPRFDAHILDLDALVHCSEFQELRMQPLIGLRLVYLSTTTASGGLAPARLRDEFAAVGLHLGLNSSWAIGETGVEIFSGAHATVLVGVELTFNYTLLEDGSSTIQWSISPDVDRLQDATVLMGHLEAGIRWSGNMWRNKVSFAAGYQCDWFNLQHALTTIGPIPTVQSGNDIMIRANGPFLRCEVKF
jgi:hypothetical protein